MTRATNSGAQGSAGSFATARRGGMDGAEMRQICNLRARGVSVQNIAKMLGRSMEDVSRVVAPEPANDVERWSFGACSETVQTVVRAVAEKHGVTLASMERITMRNSREGRARAAAYAAVREFTGLSLNDMATIFGRDQKVIVEGIQRHNASVFGAAA